MGKAGPACEHSALAEIEGPLRAYRHHLHRLGCDSARLLRTRYRFVRDESARSALNTFSAIRPVGTWSRALQRQLLRQ